MPNSDLLDPTVKQEKGMSSSEVSDTAKILQEALIEFGVEAKVTGVQQGPVVTCYEILPSAGVRVEKIKALADNLALKMHAKVFGFKHQFLVRAFVELKCQIHQD